MTNQEVPVNCIIFGKISIIITTSSLSSPAPQCLPLSSVKFVLIAITFGLPSKFRFCIFLITNYSIKLMICKIFTGRKNLSRLCNCVYCCGHCHFQQNHKNKPKNIGNEKSRHKTFNLMMYIPKFCAQLNPLECEQRSSHSNSIIRCSSELAKSGLLNAPC